MTSHKEIREKYLGGNSVIPSNDEALNEIIHVIQQATVNAVIKEILAIKGIDLNLDQIEMINELLREGNK